MSDEVWWLIRAPLNTFLVEAGSEDQARDKAREQLGYKHKPWVARGWHVKIATDEDKQTFAAFAEAHRESQPTLKTAKRKTKTARDRLFGGST